MADRNAAAPVHVATFVAHVASALLAAEDAIKKCTKLKWPEEALTRAIRLKSDTETCLRDGLRHAAAAADQRRASVAERSHPTSPPMQGQPAATLAGGDAAPVLPADAAPALPAAEEPAFDALTPPGDGEESPGGVLRNESLDFEEVMDDDDGIAPVAPPVPGDTTLAPSAVVSTSRPTSINNTAPGSPIGGHADDAKAARPLPPLTVPDLLHRLAVFAYEVLHGAVLTVPVTQAAAVAELATIRAHGRELCHLVMVEAFLTLQDVAKKRQGSRVGRVSSFVVDDQLSSDAAAAAAHDVHAVNILHFFGLKDAARALRYIFEKVFLGVYSPRAAPPPPPAGAPTKGALAATPMTAPMLTSLEDAVTRQNMKHCLDAIKYTIRISCLLQDVAVARHALGGAGAELSNSSDINCLAAASQGSAAEGSVWLQAIEAAALPLFYLLHVATDDTGAPGAPLPPVPNTIHAKTKADARSLLYQLTGLAMKQCPGQRLGAPFSSMSARELSDVFADAPVAGFVLLDSFARCVGDGDGSSAQQLALRIITEAIATAAADDPSTLRWLFTVSRYSKHLCSALASGCLSASVVALGASLRATQSILKYALVESRQEMGFLHCNALLRLLDDHNTLPELRDLIVKHLALLVSAEASCYLPPDDTESIGTYRASHTFLGNALWPAQRRYLLLDLYAFLDLDPRLHHTNIIAHLIASLSRMVRTNAQDLTPSALVAASAAGGVALGASATGHSVNTPRTVAARTPRRRDPTSPHRRPSRSPLCRC
jgi:hypothetical protein